MYFSIKNYLKSNRYHTTKHPLRRNKKRKEFNNIGIILVGQRSLGWT
jgi:hypothetical protein